MTILWLLVWILSHTPQVQVDAVHGVNNWALALGVCIVIDAMVTNLLRGK